MADRGSVGFGRRPEPGKAVAGAIALDDALAARLLPARPARGHKGTFGKLLVIAGSLDYAGAALLVCRAAGRAGAGLVTLAVPESLQPLFAAKVVEATTMGLPEDDPEETDPDGALARILDHEHDALVVGPGLRPGLATADLVRAIVAVAPDAQGSTTDGATGDVPAAVLDAEALRSLASVDRWWEAVRRPCVLTPHPGEFARLRAAGRGDGPGDGDLVGDDEARVAAAVDAARTWGHVVVLKGARTVIAAPGAPARAGAATVDAAPPRPPSPTSRTRPWRRGAPETSSRGSSARSSRRALRPSMPRGSASSCTAWPGR